MAEELVSCAVLALVSPGLGGIEYVNNTVVGETCRVLQGKCIVPMFCVSQLRTEFSSKISFVLLEAASVMSPETCGHSRWSRRAINIHDSLKKKKKDFFFLKT